MVDGRRVTIRLASLWKELRVGISSDIFAFSRLLPKSFVCTSSHAKDDNVKTSLFLLEMTCDMRIDCHSYNRDRLLTVCVMYFTFEELEQQQLPFLVNQYINGSVVMST
jgi:hypothetical protein